MFGGSDEGSQGSPSEDLHRDRRRRAARRRRLPVQPACSSSSSSGGSAATAPQASPATPIAQGSRSNGSARRFDPTSRGSRRRMCLRPRSRAAGDRPGAVRSSRIDGERALGARQELRRQGRLQPPDQAAGGDRGRPPSLVQTPDRQRLEPRSGRRHSRLHHRARLDPGRSTRASEKAAARALVAAKNAGLKDVVANDSVPGTSGSAPHFTIYTGPYQYESSAQTELTRALRNGYPHAHAFKLPSSSGKGF